MESLDLFFFSPLLAKHQGLIKSLPGTVYELAIVS